MTSVNISKEYIKFPDNSLQGSRGVSVGTILMYAGSSITDISGNFLLCDGSAYSASVYSDLYKVIGTSFGGNASAFNVPDFRGRIPKQSSISAYGGTNQIAYTHLPHTHQINNLGLFKYPYNNHRYDTTDDRPKLGDYLKDIPSVTTSNILDSGNNPINTQQAYYPPYCAVNYIICYKQ